MSRLGPHFVASEFRCSDGTPVPPAALRELENLVVVYLEPIRRRFGPVTITSGYRTAAVNERVRGASNSFHRYDLPGRYGVAADFVCRTGRPSQWAAFAEELGAGGVGRYRGFCHVDNRRGQARWRG